MGLVGFWPWVMDVGLVYLGEPVWDWCCVKIKTMEVLGLWSKSQEAHGFGGVWPWVVPWVVDVVVAIYLWPCMWL